MLKVSAEEVESVVSAGGKMCRKCFNMYECCANIVMKSLKSNATRALEVLGLSSDSMDDLTTPAPKHVAVVASSVAGPSSPDVQVREYVWVEKCHACICTHTGSCELYQAAKKICTNSKPKEGRKSREVSTPLLQSA